MPIMVPSVTKQWTVEGQKGFGSLQLNEEFRIPELGDTECLVRFHYASLNYRDLLVSKVCCFVLYRASCDVTWLTDPLQNKYLFGSNDHVVPVSDGAGTVESVGPRVTRFKPGDRVVTLLNQGHFSGALNPTTISNGGVGGVVDGTLRHYGAFNEQGLVAMPVSLTFQEASTIPCAALTAWNCLYGLESRSVKPGDTVLTQGTGGVSIFALQVCRSISSVL